MLLKSQPQQFDRLAAFCGKIFSLGACCAKRLIITLSDREPGAGQSGCTLCSVLPG